MDKESKPLTAFTLGLLRFYEHDRMPFGLTNAHATFQWLMETCHGNLNLNWCFIYLNNIVIFSKDPASHHMRLEAMFQRLEQARLKLKSSKCEPFCRQITYLGHIISAQGVATNEETISIIKRWAIQTTIPEVQSFLGFTRYYCQFIPKFVQIVWPLQKLPSSKTLVKREQLSLGMTDASSPSVNWSAYVPQHLFLPMLTLPGPSSHTPMLVGLAWGLSSTRPMMTELIPPSPMLARTWLRLRPITQPTNWTFSLLSRLWSRSSMTTSIGQLLTSIPTIPLHTIWLQKNRRTLSHHWVHPCQLQLPIIIEWGRPTSMWMPWQGCPGPCVCPMPWAPYTESLQWQYKPCRRLPSRVPQVSLKHTAVTCVLWTCWRMVHTKDRQQAQLADLFLGQVIVKMQDGTLGQSHTSWLTHLSSCSSFGNATTSSWGMASCTEKFCKKGPRRHCFSWYCQLCTGILLWKDAMMRSAT